MSMPRMASAAAPASAASLARRMPPALPRPSTRTWALTGHGVAQSLGGGDGALGGGGHVAGRHRDPEGAQVLLALVLVEVYAGRYNGGEGPPPGDRGPRRVLSAFAIFWGVALGLGWSRRTPG